MRKLLPLLIVLLSFFSSAQISNLASLAQGDLRMFAPIYDSDKSVFGYFSLYKADDISANEEKFSYVVLDKNLNKVSNGDFVDTKYKGITSRYYTPDKAGDRLILTKRYVNISGNVDFTSSRILELSTNDLSEPFFIENNSVTVGSRPVKTIKKIQRKRDFINIPVGMANGYLVIQIKKSKALNNPNEVCFYDFSHNKLWCRQLTKDLQKEYYGLTKYEDGAIYFITKNNSREHQLDIVSLDVKSGEENFRYTLENKSSEYSHNMTINVINGKVVLTGKVSPYKSSGYDGNNSTGLFKIVVDANGQETFKKYFFWEEANAFLEMSKNGKLEKGYKLFAHSYFVFKDESIVVLSEKYKSAYNLLLGAHTKTEDFILMKFDSDFNLELAEAIEKDMTKFSNSDFLFSQYLNDKKDAVFYYYDYQKDSETKDKNWVLGIVSLINGKINHEKVPMSSDDFLIRPYIAKEGYILLREFNKNSEFNNIRLERLNLQP